jgi:carbon storage regulator
MLVLSRRPGEKIAIGENIQVVILKIKGETIQIAIQAPGDVRIRRSELSAKEGEVDETPNPLPAENRPVLLPFKPKRPLLEGRVFRRSPLGEFIEAIGLRDSSVGADSHSIEDFA